MGEINEKTGELESFSTRLGRCYTSPQFKHSLWGCCDEDPNAVVTKEDGTEEGGNCLSCLCICDAVWCPSLHATVWRDYGLCCSTVGGCFCGPACVGGLGHACLRQKVASAS